MKEKEKKVFCKHCKYRSGGIFTYCEKSIRDPQWSSFNDECLDYGKLLNIRNNDNGDCEHFEPKLTVRIFNYIRGLFL